MLIISDQTFTGLQVAVAESWLKRVVPQVIAARPDWSKQVGVSIVTETCREIEAFTSNYAIDSMDNFWRLLDAVIHDQGALTQISEYQDFALKRTGFSQDLRVTRFVCEVKEGRRTQLLELNG